MHREERESETAPHRFRVNLRGVIDLLANHLYSTPQVFVRELLQNSVDAIVARRQVEPGHAGAIDIELVPGVDDGPPTLVVRDDGIGLDEEEVHGFLATIGSSSKREVIEDLRADFIGQFGIGLLSCFLVADEISVVTRAAREGSPSLHWEGRSDGTYDLRRLERDVEPGTTVFLRARSSRREYFETESVERLVRKFGEFLPVPIRLDTPRGPRRLNEGGAPWRREFRDDASRDEAMRELCREHFDFEPMDWLPLRSVAGEADGVAFVMPSAVSIVARSTHRVYLRNMLLAEEVDELLPRWAFFVRAIVNVNDLRPTASREALYENEDLSRTSRTLGRCLKRYLTRLAEADPERLRSLVSTHHLAMKAIALEDDGFYRLVTPWIPFESSAGWTTLGEIREDTDDVLYAKTRDEFRQLAPIAAARDITVLNACHTFDEEFLSRLSHLDPEVVVRPVDTVGLLEGLAAPSREQMRRFERFLATAEAALADLDCRVELRSFPPRELPALYCRNEDAGLSRSISLAEERADSLWSGIMDRIRPDAEAVREGAVLFLNVENALVERLTGTDDPSRLRLVTEVLYVQALLQGHHPLQSAELRLLNSGLARLLDLALTGEGE